LHRHGPDGAHPLSRPRHPCLVPRSGTEIPVPLHWAIAVVARALQSRESAVGSDHGWQRWDRVGVHAGTDEAWLRRRPASAPPREALDGEGEAGTEDTRHQGPVVGARCIMRLG
jgi:hypothetical protein